MNITHDFHIHTRLSLCSGKDGGTLSQYLESAKEQGLKTLGFADHFWDAGVGFDSLYINSKNVNGVPSYYKTQNFEHISALKREIEATDTGDVKVLFGAEGEYDPVNHGVGITEEVAEQLDFLIVPNSHTHMMMDVKYYETYELHRDYMINALEEIVNCKMSKYVKAIAHPFSPVQTPLKDAIEILKRISDDTFKRIFTLCAEKGIALEINTSCMGSLYANTSNTEEYERMFALGKASGCRFSFGSDAHTLGGHVNHVKISEFCAEKFGLDASDIADFVK